MAQEINSMNKFYRKLVAIFVGGLVMIMAVFLVVIPLLSYADKPAYLDVLVAPNEAKVVIEDVSNKKDGISDVRITIKPNLKILYDKRSKILKVLLARL